MRIDEFIAARLYEDDMAAFGGHVERYDRGDEWRVFKMPRGDDELAPGIFVFPAEAPPYSTTDRIIDGETGHIEHFDPARAQRQVMALRKLLARYSEAQRESARSERDAGFEAGMNAALVAIAAFWSDHEDFQPEWLTQS